MSAYPARASVVSALIGAAGAMLLLATLSLAASPATDTTIYACSDNRSGAMRKVATAGGCTAKETLMSWNTAGPAGPTGSPGPSGQPGTPGPSAAYTSYVETITSYLDTAGSIALSAGDYVFAFSSMAYGGNYFEFSCLLNGPPSSIAGPTLMLSASGGSVRANYLFQRGFSLPSATTVTVTCSGNNGFLSSRGNTLTVIRVGSLTAQ